MAKNVKKTVAGFADRSTAGPSGGPNLTIFAGRQYQIKVPYRVSLNSIQKYGLGPQRRICCNLFITHTGTTNMVFCGGGGGLKIYLSICLSIYVCIYLSICIRFEVEHMSYN